MNKKIFITGGAGFIANTLIRKYVNDNKIIVYDNFHRDTLTNSEFGKHPNITISARVLMINHSLNNVPNKIYSG
jgi:nucleoside-diphosphate-sugar epimerase